MDRHVRAGRGLVVLAFLFAVLAVPVSAAPADLGRSVQPDAPTAAVPITGAYAQDFNTLASSGASSFTPAGWELLESGANANTTYTASTGGSNAGDTYSFGVAASAERAFGGILSGNLVPTIGVQIQNNTGGTIADLAIQYNCEQWRLGATGRADRLDFQYSTDATSLATGAWTDVNPLDCSSFVTTGTVGALDGNTNRSSVSSTITGLTLAQGATFWLRWTDLNASGADDGLAVDDFALSPTLTGGDSAPAVQSTTPAPNSSGVPAATPVSITFTEPVTFSGPISIVCSGGTQAGITPSGGPTTWSLVHADFAPGDTCSITIPAGQVSDVDTNDPPDAMPVDYTWSFAVAAGCGGATTRIHAVQGSSATSPLAGNTVSVEGVVVGDFQASTQLRGFFVQEEPADFDADPATSEGIFVFEGASSLLDVTVGDKVRLTGTVVEYADRTVGGGTITELSSLSAVQTCSTGNPVSPVSVTLPETVDGELERYESMLISIASPMTISQNYFLGRYGQMTLSSSGRMFQSTNVYDPGSLAQVALANENARRLLILDDGRAGVRCGDNPNPVPYLGGPPPAVIRAGDGVSTLVGVLDYGQINSGSTGSCSDGATLFAGDFRLHPTQPPVFTPTNPRPAAPPAVGGTLQVASANLLNYFNTFGTTSCTLGVGGATTECRGADTQAEFDRQAAKLVQAIVNNGADVIGFMEMENDGYGSTSAVQNLIDRLNAATVAGTYAFVNPDATLGVNALGVDAIKVGVIYKPAKVTPVGTAVLNSPAFTDPRNSGAQKSRPALAQTFEDTTWGERFTIVVNHLKSKGSSCNTASNLTDDDPVQGNCNGTRTDGAAAEVGWINSTLMPSSGDTDVLVMGDMNAYAKEDPIDPFIAGGYTNLIEQFHGVTGYSYIFDGMSGNLDHALASSGLSSRVTGASEWHINADEPTVIDYDQNFNPAGYYTADPYRSSDHDPLSAGLNLNPDLGDLASSYGQAWHTDGGKLRLGQVWTGEATSTPGGDTGDDGISVDTSLWQRGGATAITAVVTGGSGWLAGWADWDNDGQFATPAERIVNQLVTSGSNTIGGISIPGDAAVGVPIAMRFRLFAGTTEPVEQAPLAALPAGRGNGGEVEDRTVQPLPLASTLASFEATAEAAGIRIVWETTSEIDTQGFNLYRSTSPIAPQSLMAWVPSQAPGSVNGASYDWLDQDTLPGEAYYYWLERVDLSGATTLHGPVSASAQAPTAVTLSDLKAGSQTARATGPTAIVLLLLASITAMELLRRARLPRRG